MYQRQKSKKCGSNYFSSSQVHAVPDGFCEYITTTCVGNFPALPRFSTSLWCVHPQVANGDLRCNNHAEGYNSRLKEFGLHHNPWLFSVLSILAHPTSGWRSWSRQENDKADRERSFNSKADLAVRMSRHNQKTIL